MEEETFRRNRSNQKMEEMVVIEGEFAVVPEKEVTPDEAAVMDAFWKNCSKYGVYV